LGEVWQCQGERPGSRCWKIVKRRFTAEWGGSNIVPMRGNGFNEGKWFICGAGHLDNTPKWVNIQICLIPSSISKKDAEKSE